MKDTYIPEVACIMFVLGMVGFAMLLQGCTQFKVDTMEQCSMDSLTVAGIQMSTDVNCTNQTFREIQEKSIINKAIRFKVEKMAEDSSDDASTADAAAAD